MVIRCDLWCYKHIIKLLCFFVLIIIHILGEKWTWMCSSIKISIALTGKDEDHETDEYRVELHDVLVESTWRCSGRLQSYLAIVATLGDLVIEFKCCSWMKMLIFVFSRMSRSHQWRSNLLIRSNVSSSVLNEFFSEIQLMEYHSVSLFNQFKYKTIKFWNL